MSAGLISGLSLLAHFAAEREPQTIREAAEAVGIRKATAYRMVEDLEREGWLIASDGMSPRRYAASFEVVRIGLLALGANRVREAAMPNAIMLARTVQKTCTVAFYDRGDIVLTDSVDVLGDRVMPVPRGDRVPAACGASGKILLAFQPLDELHRVASKGLPRFTALTKTEPADILRDIELTRQRGYGLADREFNASLGGISVPVFDRDGTVAAAIGVHAGEPVSPKFIADVVEQAQLRAAVASAELGYHPASRFSIP